MAIGINSIYNSYAGIGIKSADNGWQAAKTKASGTAGQSGLTGLSAKAQKLLEKLQTKYDKADFMVADTEEETKAMLAGSAKEVSVVFSREELEKMASDEKYEQEYLNRVDQALGMSARINEEFGMESVFGEAGKDVKINKISISFGTNGSTTILADLEKSTAKQKERLEEAKEKKQEDAQKNKAETVKRTTVQAGSVEELIQNIKNVDWDSIEETAMETGKIFDISA